MLDNHNRTADDLIQGTTLSAACVHGMLNGTTEISPEHAQALGGFFEVSPQVWLNAQAIYEDECPPDKITTAPCTDC